MKQRIEIKLRRKTNQELVETIIKAKKNANWIKIAHAISTPRRNHASINLDQINKEAQDKDVVLVPGKVLGMGSVDKKIKIVALGFSETAKQKLDKAKIHYSDIYSELKNNPDAKNIKLMTI